MALIIDTIFYEGDNDFSIQEYLDFGGDLRYYDYLLLISISYNRLQFSFLG